MEGLRGKALARNALETFQLVQGKYPSGITVPELLEELRHRGRKIAHADERLALQSALNDSQARGVWSRVARGLWLPGNGFDKTASGLYGQDLADAVYPFVQRRYPNGTFHYEKAREELEATGVDVRGTGHVMLHALNGSPLRFEKLPGRKGFWRWK